MWALVACFVLLFMFFDVYYTLSTVYVVLKCLACNTIYGVIDIFSPVSVWGICTTTDLDFMWHMNNARYLRNADRARFEFFMRTGLYKAAKKRGAVLVVGATTIRFRREIKPFESYRIHCKLVCWDDQSFYIEHRYERCRDKFISAIFTVRQRVVKSTPSDLLVELTGSTMQSPPIPPDVKAWIQSNDISSENLRKAQ